MSVASPIFSTSFQTTKFPRSTSELNQSYAYLPETLFQNHVFENVFPEKKNPVWSFLNGLEMLQFFRTTWFDIKTTLYHIHENESMLRFTKGTRYNMVVLEINYNLLKCNKSQSLELLLKLKFHLILVNFVMQRNINLQLIASISRVPRSSNLY